MHFLNDIIFQLKMRYFAAIFALDVEKSSLLKWVKEVDAFS